MRQCPCIQTIRLNINSPKRTFRYARIALPIGHSSLPHCLIASLPHCRIAALLIAHCPLLNYLATVTPLKYHYNTLGIEPSATVTEIKKAYRQLAHQFHPDKTNHDPYASARFEAIKEAYETLTNPVKKEKYLQQRWYHQSIGRKK